MKRILLMMLFLILAISVFATEEDNPATKPTEHTLIIKAYKPKFDLADEGGIRLIITDALTESEMSSLDTVNSNATALNLDSYAKAYLGNVNNPQRVIFSYRIESSLGLDSYADSKEFDLAFDVEPFYYYSDSNGTPDKSKYIDAGYAISTETTNFADDYSNDKKIEADHTVYWYDFPVVEHEKCNHTLSLKLYVDGNSGDIKSTQTGGQTKEIQTTIKMDWSETYSSSHCSDKNLIQKTVGYDSNYGNLDWIARGAVSMAIDESGYENAERGYYRSNVKVTLTYNG